MLIFYLSHPFLKEAYKQNIEITNNAVTEEVTKKFSAQSENAIKVLNDNFDDDFKKSA